MPRKFKNKYRITSTRLRSWDYGWNGAYFITICTHKRQRFFGSIDIGKMILSPIGLMAEKYWYEIPEHFPFVKLGAFVVMPDHVHGIIIIDKLALDDAAADDALADDAAADDTAADDTAADDAAADDADADDADADDAAADDAAADDAAADDADVQAQDFAPLRDPSDLSPKNKFGPQSKNLASIIRGYKIGVTKNAKKINPKWKWQSRYHDHIIRNEMSYNRIENYIIDNPKNWKKI